MAARLVGRIILIIVLTIVALLFIGWLFRAPLTARILTKALQTPVHIDDLTLSLNHIELTGLRIKNPGDGKISDALLVNRIYVNMRVMDLFDDVIPIKQILIDKPHLGLELYNVVGSDNNWARMINRINQSSGSHKADVATEKKVIITLFQINDLMIDAYSLPTHSKLNLSPISQISLKDVGAPSGVPYSQAANIISRAIIAQIAKDARMPEIMKNLEKLPENLLKFLPDEMKGHGLFSWPIFGK